jgi:hypothetical protein
LLYDIEIICAQLNLELVTTPVRENGEYSLEDIRLFKTLYFDGLTKQSFFDSLVAIGTNNNFKSAELDTF